MNQTKQGRSARPVSAVRTVAYLGLVFGPATGVISAADVTSIYDVPLMFHAQGLDEKIAELAANGDLDAIKLLNERMQDREELKLRKKLFGV